MILEPDEAALFYRAWWPLLAWVNNKKRVVPAFPTPTPERPLSIAVAHPIRLALWNDDALREQYLAERGSALAADERALIASWKHRVSGQFVVFKHLRSHSILLHDDVFAVVGIYSPLAELVRAPRYVNAVLLPFGDRITFDGILTAPDVQLSFGPGMRRSFNSQYADARARSRIRTSLLPVAPASAPRASAKRAKPARSIAGTWRITETEVWDRAALDLVEVASLHLGDDQLGELSMIALRASVDYRLETRDGKPAVAFSFLGEDDGHPCSGRAWATLDDDDVLRGRLYLHGGHDSAFEAHRIAAKSSGRKPRSRRA